MLSAIIWGAMSALSFILFFTLPEGPSGPNYLVLIPGFIALAASIHQAAQHSEPATDFIVATPPPACDQRLVAETEKLRHDKLDEDSRMLRHQSSRRRAAIASSRQQNNHK